MMVVGVVEVKIHIPWIHSLKEKRMVVKSLCAKVQNKFNVSIAEVDLQDKHQMIVLGFACVAGNNSQGHSICDTVLNFIENNTEGRLLEVKKELQ